MTQTSNTENEPNLGVSNPLAQKLGTHPQGADGELEQLRRYPVRAWVEYLYACDNQDPADQDVIIEQYTDGFMTLIAAQTDAAHRAKVDESAEWLLSQQQDGKVDIKYIDALISYKGARPSSELQHLKSQQTNTACTKCQGWGFYPLDIPIKEAEDCPQCKGTGVQTNGVEEV